MNNINLNLYRIFYIVAKSKSFVEASSKLYISQPAISKDIKSLESVLKTKLIYRKNNGIELTRDGQDLLIYLEEVFGIINIAEKKIEQQNNLSSGNMSIGCPSHISALFLMEKIESFKKIYPNIKIQVMSGSTEMLIEMLELHKVDFVIDAAPVNSMYNNLEIRKISSFETIFISNKKIRLADVRELQTRRLILPFEFSNTRKELNKVFEKNNILIKDVSLEFDTTDLIINAVKRDLGIGYVIENSVKQELANQTIYKVDIDIELPKTDVYLLNIKNQLTNINKIFISSYVDNTDIT